MFERYTEKARRAIFFARYESSQFGSPTIESEHLLLGLLREDRKLAKRAGLGENALDSIRDAIERERPRVEKVSTSVELPLSEECKHILADAAEEAERMSDKHIGTGHLLLGILREKKCYAARLLNQRGVKLAEAREKCFEEKNEELSKPPAEAATLLSEFTRDLTQAAQENQLDPLIGREAELDRVVEILCLRSRNNPVLVGEPGVGKSALVEGLALRVASGEAPARLEGKRIVALDLPSLVAVLGGSRQFDEDAKAAMQELEAMRDAIVFVEGLFSAGGGTLGVARILKPLLDRDAIQCIAAALPSEHSRWTEREPWLAEHFYPVTVPPPSEADAIRILSTIKKRYEQFHGVEYSEEALEHAVYYSQRFLPKGHLPDKAIDLIDEAGAALAVRRSQLPEEIVDVRKRLKFVMHRMEIAVANHELEKARFYSDQERKERENLRALEEKYHLPPASTGTVGLDEIESVLARWTNIPIETIRLERRKV